MKNVLRWLDPLFGLTLAASLLMVVITAWPRAAQAGEAAARGAEAGTEQRSVADFEAVQTLGPDVLLRQGQVPTAMVQADRRLLALLETVVEQTQHGKTLVLRWKRGTSVTGWPQPRVTLTAPAVSALVVSGSGAIVAGGRTGQLAVSIAGSGDVQAEGLRAEVVTVKIAGSGDASVNAEQSLAVSIAGSGDVVYRGNARISQRVAGSGTVSRR